MGFSGLNRQKHAARQQLARAHQGSRAEPAHKLGISDTFALPQRKALE